MVYRCLVEPTERLLAPDQRQQYWQWLFGVFASVFFVLGEAKAITAKKEKEKMTLAWLKLLK
jgi:hypothetical protein